MTILGTRPEIIRLSRVLARLDEQSSVDHVLVHTGQNYDYTLNEVFFDDLQLRPPDVYLDCETTSLGATYGDILRRSEVVLREHQPDAVLILGDTNSALAAIMARRMHIPVFHMEAGNRSFDWRVPEETNRRIVDHISDINLTYTEHARANLLREGLHPQRVYVTGSPMREVLEFHRERIESSDVLDRLGLDRRSYIIASAHREETVDDAERLSKLLDGMVTYCTARGLRLVLSTHPRTRKRLGAFGLTERYESSIDFAEPFGFLDYNHLQMHAACAVSDSGTIAEESAILGFPAVTPRDWVERPEALDAGSVIVTGLEPDVLVRSIDYAIDIGSPLDIPEDYRVTNCSDRVLRFLLGRSRLLRETQR